MPWLQQIALWACVILGQYYFVQALRNLAAGHPESRWRILLWSKLFAHRDNFTDLGWRYRNRALVMMLATFILVFAGGLFRF